MTPELLHVLMGAERGGCETNSWNLVRELDEVRHRVAVLGVAGPMCSAWRDVGADVVVLGRAPVGGRLAAAELRRLTAERRPDAVMIWHGVVNLPQMIRALNSLGAPIGVHGGNPAWSMPRWVDWKFELLEKLYPPRGPLPTYVCCSQYVADSFESSKYLRRFPRVVVPNGVRIPPGPTHQPRPLRNDDQPIIGMSARLNSIKDHATLVRAMSRARLKFPRAVLELAGDGEQREPLEQLADKLGLSNCVRFLGEVADIYGCMSRWDLFAYATTENEGLGNAVAEAMMLGLPCVITDVGPMHEFSGSGNTVRLVKAADPWAMADAICELLAAQTIRTSLSVEGRQHALATFHPATFSRRYAEVLGLSGPDTVDDQTSGNESSMVRSIC